MINYIIENYIILDWAKPLAGKLMTDCINYGIRQSLIDEQHEKYKCKSEVYHFASCFFDVFDKLYKNHVDN